MSRAEDDLVDLTVTFIQGGGYPSDCTDNLKRIIRRKAETLIVRKGEVFFTKWTKEPGRKSGKKKASGACN